MPETYESVERERNELRNAVLAVYEADCNTDPTLRGGMSVQLSDALARLYRAAGLVED